MNWKQLIADMQARGETMQTIADKCGFASSGHVHNLASGKQSDLKWTIGVSMIDLHKRVMRRKARK